MHTTTPASPRSSKRNSNSYFHSIKLPLTRRTRFIEYGPEFHHFELGDVFINIVPVSLVRRLLLEEVLVIILFFVRLRYSLGTYLSRSGPVHFAFVEGSQLLQNQF